MVSEKIAPIVVLVVCVSFLFLVFFLSIPQTSSKISSDVCSQIRGTPAWLQNNEIIDYGKKDWNVSHLIEQKISFVWDPKCIHCENQIDFWGSADWMSYQSSNLTIQCNLLS